MKLYIEAIKLAFNVFIRKQKSGTNIKKLCLNMGSTVYIKLAQLLATQNLGNIFTEEDRLELTELCDKYDPIDFKKIEKQIKKEYNKSLDEIFLSIDKEPIGSASISQVHKAVLKNGDVVAVKVKRKDITDGIEKDIKQIRKCMHKFGKFIGFNNLIGGDTALDLYLKWIYEETDFVHEVNNIKKYKQFSDEVNNKVRDTKKIKLPKVYEDLCTENIIVMEYIEHKTINDLELNEENKKKISTAINSYLKCSFYALFNDKQLVFHGDPHGGNVYIDDDGNIGFLDMGLLFSLSEEDTNIIKPFYLSAFSGNSEKLYNLLIPYAQMSDENKMLFKKDIEEFCKNVNKKVITQYFTDIIEICIKYNYCPPKFLFCMAKAFVYLNGINGFTNNLTTGRKLLQGQTIEFFIKRSLKDCIEIINSGVKIAPEVINDTIKYGVTEAIGRQDEFKNKFVSSYQNVKEALEMLQALRKFEKEDAKTYSNTYKI